MEPEECEDVRIALKSILRELRNSVVVTRQACYKPQAGPLEENEEAWPIVGLPVYQASGQLLDMINEAAEQKA